MHEDIDDEICNDSGNRPFADIVEHRIDRRDVVSGGLAVAAATFFAPPASAKGLSKGRGNRPGAQLLGFKPVPLAAGNGPVPVIHSCRRPPAISHAAL